MDALIASNIQVLASDPKSKSILASFSNDVNVLITMVKQGAAVQLENSIHFPVKILNLKTMCSISSTAYATGIAITGISVVNSNTSKFYLGKEISYTSALSDMREELTNLADTILTIESYITLRLNQSALINIDISMFKDIDVGLLDALRMGEKRSFVYRTWEAFIASKELENANPEDTKVVIDIINACKEFELKNNMMLDEIGDVLWDELIANDQITEAVNSKDFAIN